MLVINQEIRDAISSNLRKDKLRELVYSSDVITLLQDGLEKVIEGQTTFEEIIKLIELENDDTPKAGHYGLHDAIKQTNIAHNSNNNNNKNDNNKPKEEHKDKNNDDKDEFNLDNLDKEIEDF